MSRLREVQSGGLGAPGASSTRLGSVWRIRLDEEVKAGVISCALCLHQSQSLLEKLQLCDFFLPRLPRRLYTEIL